MRRKIPGKKHRGIKDPLEQQAKRNELLKNKINAAPSNPDDQELPRSFLEVSRLMKLTQEGKFQNSKKKKKLKRKKPRLISTAMLMGAEPKLPGMIQEDKVLPPMQQLAHESEQGFLERIQSATDDLINEAAMENKFNVKISRDKSGQVEKVEMGIPNEDSKSKNKKKFKTSKKPKEIQIKRLSKVKRRQLKIGKNKDEENGDGKKIIERKYDNVKFGEVVHEPPHLKRLPRGANKNNPKGKQLLLNSLLGERTSQNNKMSMSMQQKSEKQRLEVVAAYRELKKQRYKNKIKF